MTFKNAKTILFASLIAAMILPFTGMNIAHADEQTIEELNTKIQNTMNTIEKVQNKINNASDTDRKDRLENRLSLLQERLDSQIEKLVTLSEPIFESNRIAAQERNAAIMEKFNNLYETDSEYVEAVEIIRSLDSINIEDDQYWNQVVSALEVTVAKSNDSKNFVASTQSTEDMTKLRDVLKENLVQNEVSRQLQSAQNQLSTQSVACDSIKDDATPALFQPQFDYNSPNSNALTNVYTVMYEGASIDSSLSGKCVLEVNLVYEDEDIWTSGGTYDLAYDEIRKALYGRIADIETMYVVADESTGTGERMSFVELTLYPKEGLIDEQEFKAIHDGTNPGWYDANVHFIAQVYPAYSYAGHPVVFVNTWNHALGETYTSSTFPAYAIQLDNYAGTATRPMVENNHSSNEYESWYDISPLP